MTGSGHGVRDGRLNVRLRTFCGGWEVWNNYRYCTERHHCGNSLSRMLYCCEIIAIIRNHEILSRVYITQSN